MDNIAAVLQYGALGLLAIAMIGFFWYVRNVEARAARREQVEQERQDKYIEALIKSTSTMAVLVSRLQTHDERMQQDHRILQEEHKAIINECFSRRGIGE